MTTATKPRFIDLTTFRKAAAQGRKESCFAVNSYVPRKPLKVCGEKYLDSDDSIRCCTKHAGHDGYHA